MMYERHWLPRHGEPLCIWERISQAIVKILAFAPIYIAIVVTLMLLMMLFGIPALEGR